MNVTSQLAPACDRERPRAAAGLAVTAVCAAAIAASAAHAQPALQIHALTGAPAAGAEQGTVYRDFEVPIANGLGQVAWIGSLEGASVHVFNEEALWRIGATGPELLIRTGAPVPGGAPGAAFLDLRTFLLTDSGALFLESEQTQGLGRGIWRLGTGVPEAVVRAGDPAPGLDQGWFFTGSQSGFSASDDDELATLSQVVHAVTSQTVHGVWLADENGLQLVAVEGAPIPGSAVTAPAAEIRGARISPFGEISFYGALALRTGLVTADNDAVNWAGPPGNIHILAREGDFARPQLTFDEPGRPFPAGPGAWTFHAWLDPGDPFAFRDQSVWRFAAGQLAAVALEGEPAPNLLPGTRFRTVLPSGSNRAGAFMISVTLAGTGVTSSADQAVYVDRTGAGQLELLVREGVPAPAMEPGVRLAGLSGAGLDDEGRALFEAHLVGQGIIQDLNDEGLWFIDRNQRARPVIRLGQCLQLGGNVRRVASYDRRPVTGTGTLPLRITFDDQTQAVASVRLADLECPADVNGDALVDLSDLLLFVDNWFAGSLAANHDGDCDTDVFDLLVFLDEWFIGGC